MHVVIVFLVVLCLALGAFAWAHDALATYEHEQYLIEAERTNQIQVHEAGVTQREVINSAAIASSINRQPSDGFIKLPSSAVASTVSFAEPYPTVTIEGVFAQVRLDKKCSVPDVASLGYDTKQVNYGVWDIIKDGAAYRVNEIWCAVN